MVRIVTWARGEDGSRGGDGRRGRHSLRLVDDGVVWNWDLITKRVRAGSKQSRGFDVPLQRSAQPAYWSIEEVIFHPSSGRSS